MRDVARGQRFLIAAIALYAVTVVVFRSLNLWAAAGLGCAGVLAVVGLWTLGAGSDASVNGPVT